MTFIDPRTDLAFKKIFASESSKPILISFLNALIYEGNETIESIKARISQLSSDRLDSLTEAFLNFDRVDDLVNWLQ